MVQLCQMRMVTGAPLQWERNQMRSVHHNFPDSSFTVICSTLHLDTAAAILITPRHSLLLCFLFVTGSSGIILDRNAAGLDKKYLLWTNCVV